MGRISCVSASSSRSCCVETGVPFHRSAPVSVITSSFLSGFGGGTLNGGGDGKSSFTIWVCGGMVMISMMRSTSRTSISGVVFMPAIGLACSATNPCRIATLLDGAQVSHKCRTAARNDSEQKRAAPGSRPRTWCSHEDLEDVRVIFVSDETHLLDVGFLGDRQHFVDQLITRRRVGLQVQLGDRVHLLGGFEILFQLLLRDGRAVPGDRALRRDADRVLERFDRRRRLMRVLRQIQLHGVGLRRDGDDQHDDENQQDIDQRRYVHVHHRFAGSIIASGLHRHSEYSYSRAAGPPPGCEMNPTRWNPASCMVRITAPIHLYGVLMSPRMCASGILSSLMFCTPPTALIWSSSFFTARSSRSLCVTLVSCQ